MIYYCIYKDECLLKDCVYQKTNSKFSVEDEDDHEDLTINGFTCSMFDDRIIRLISDERIICNEYRECSIDCIFKRNYITVLNFEKYLGQKNNHANIL